MLVSILMPVYNTEAYLSECLDSICSQSYREWELIAVDDFSTDLSRQILNEYALMDERIKVLSNNKKGIIPALNNAFLNSKGKLITRMDADDKMSSKKIESLVGLFSQTNKRVIATGKVAYFSETTLGEGYKKYAEWLNDIQTAENIYDYIYKECVIPSPCWMIHREDLIACGAFDSDIYPEDYDLCFRFYEHQFQVVSSKEVLHHWRDYSNRTSRTQEVYANNSFLELKVFYFKKLDWDKNKTLILWGAGKKGKKIARLLQDHQVPFTWLCNNPSKVGHWIYDVELFSTNNLPTIKNPQAIIAVAEPQAQIEIHAILKDLNLQEGKEYFFFC
ncbi:MAG: glycosyltransferase family 2 protein [Bacteroidota bacterium]